MINTRLRGRHGCQTQILHLRPTMLLFIIREASKFAIGAQICRLTGYHELKLHDSLPARAYLGILCTNSGRWRTNVTRLQQRGSRQDRLPRGLTLLSAGHCDASSVGQTCAGKETIRQPILRQIYNVYGCFSPLRQPSSLSCASSSCSLRRH